MQLPYNLGISFLYIYPRETKTYVHKQNPYTEVFSSFIYNSHKRQTTQMPFDEWALHQRGHTRAVGPCSVMRRREPLIHSSLGESPESLGEWKKPVPQSYKLCDSTYVTFLKWQNYRCGEQISSCQRLKRAGGLKGVGYKSGCGYKRPAGGVFVVVGMSVSCQYPGCDTVLQCYLGEPE